MILYSLLLHLLAAFTDCLISERDVQFLLELIWIGTTLFTLTEPGGGAFINPPSFTLFFITSICLTMPSSQELLFRITVFSWWTLFMLKNTICIHNIIGFPKGNTGVPRAIFFVSRRTNVVSRRTLFVSRRTYLVSRRTYLTSSRTFMFLKEELLVEEVVNHQTTR